MHNLPPINYYVWGWGSNAAFAARYLHSLESTSNKRLCGIICSEEEQASILKEERFSAEVALLSSESFIHRVSSGEILSDTRVIVSPGLPPSDPHYAKLQTLLTAFPITIESAFELGLENFEGKVIAVTGSNGKSTLVTMLAQSLRGCGLRAEALGNIGQSVCEYFFRFPEKKLDWIVLELSSFQLYHYSLQSEKKKKRLWDVACILNITPNHLDWHKDMPDYVSAKAQILLGLKDEGRFWIDGEARKRILQENQAFSKSCQEEKNRCLEVLKSACEISYKIEKSSLFLDQKAKTLHLTTSFANSLKEELFKLAGSCEHYGSASGNDPGSATGNDPGRDAGSALGNCDEKRTFFGHDAAYFQLTQEITKTLGLPQEKVAHSMLQYQKMAHRLEWIASFGGIDFVNDSKATSLEAVGGALEAYASQPLHLLVGGKSKVDDFSCWTSLVRKGNLKKVYCFGECGKKIEETIEPYISVECFDNLEQAFQAAYSCAKKGDCVILSPGCSSFDQYKNFERRGESFKKMVLGLAPHSHSS